LLRFEPNDEATVFPFLNPPCRKNPCVAFVISLRSVRVNYNFLIFWCQYPTPAMPAGRPLAPVQGDDTPLKKLIGSHVFVNTYRKKRHSAIPVKSMFVTNVEVEP